MKSGFRWITGFSLGLAISVKAAEPGFVPLFNGEDLSGWVNVNCAESTWSVRDETIICTGFPTGVLRTTRHYENFILELEWKHLHEGGNAGLFIYSDPVTARGQPFTRSIECQVMDGNHGDMFAIHGATMVPDRPHPKGWMRCLPSEKRANPAGEWNHYRVESRDGRLTLAVNGKVVSGGADCVPRKGYICLESEGSEVHFRNIRIKELPSSNPPAKEVAEVDQGFRALYNGVDLNGWMGASEDMPDWRVRDWILEYDGTGEGKDQAVWSDEGFEDFTLIVDRRVEEDGVASALPVLIRKGYRLPTEIESVLSEHRPEPDRWNRFRITLNGERLTVAVNGKTVIESRALPGLPESGPIGLAPEENRVRYANIYLKELD
jgi:hypothetical protein